MLGIMILDDVNLIRCFGSDSPVNAHRLRVSVFISRALCSDRCDLVTEANDETWTRVSSLRIPLANRNRIRLICHPSFHGDLHLRRFGSFGTFETRSNQVDLHFAEEIIGTARWPSSLSMLFGANTHNFVRPQSRLEGAPQLVNVKNE